MSRTGEDPLRRFQQVLDDYEALEPGSSDTWNPLLREAELEHRIELLRRLAGAMRHALGVSAGQGDPQEQQAALESLRVLDVGCGNGRSTRMYLELGLRPEQLCGVDLRAGALDRARQLHPNIRFFMAGSAEGADSSSGLSWELPPVAVNWMSACTVFSSVRGDDARQALCARMKLALAAGGHLFFWDRLHALDFAGGDPLRAEALFPEWEPVWDSLAIVQHYGGSSGADGEAPPAWTHRAVLLRKPAP